MIFVTLGTQDKSFERLLRDIQKQIDADNPDVAVFVENVSMIHSVILCI